jgi:Tfp pilus assembly protein PilN
MINLLPADYRLKLRYGRLNARLTQWLVISLAVIGGLMLILGAGRLYLAQQTRSLNQSITTTQNQLKEQNLEQVQKQAEEISQNIRVIEQVLKREIRFSDLIQEIGQVMPRGAVLNSLTLSEKVSGALDLNANAKNYESAAQIAVNLSDPKNNLFTKVDIINISCSSANRAYPCTGAFRALFDAKTSQRFLNVATGESQ